MSITTGSRLTDAVCAALAKHGITIAHRSPAWLAVRAVVRPELERLRGKQELGDRALDLSKMALDDAKANYEGRGETIALLRKALALLRKALEASQAEIERLTRERDGARNDRDMYREVGNRVCDLLKAGPLEGLENAAERVAAEVERLRRVEQAARPVVLLWQGPPNRSPWKRWAVVHEPIDGLRAALEAK